MRPPEDEVLLRDMLDHARKATAATRGCVREELARDDLLAAGLERFTEVVGEAASKVSDPTRRQLPEIPWREIVGMRKRLVHGYASVDHDVIWDVATVDLPALVLALEAALRDG
ncbi:MAG: HepT-like ribonuclease domain-containing protein [Thermoanaerobaculia bacterium]